MVRLWWSVAVLALAGACGGEESEASAAQEPEAVRPVEVVAEDGEEAEPEAESDEVTRLRARVAELEQQLAQCQENRPATPGNVPAGVDPPASAPDAGRPRDAGRPVDAGRRRADDGTIRLPDPTGIIFGR
jgi:hypothetical protein